MQSQVIDTFIKQCELFEGFDDEQFRILSVKARPAEFSEGEIIYAKDSSSDNTFYLIVSGEVGVMSESGQHLDTLGPGQVIGEIAAVSPQKRRTINVRAAKTTEVLEWDIREVGEMLPDLIKRLKDLAWKRVTNWYE